jgi:hypothetical protein
MPEKSEKEKELELLKLKRRRAELRKNKRQKGATAEGGSAADFFTETAKGAAAGALGLAGEVGEQVGRYTTAPTRAGFTEAATAEGDTGVRGFAEGFSEQFGRPTAEAPTGEEQIEMATGMGEGWPRYLLGIGAEVIQDPTLLISGAAATKPGKMLSKAARRKLLGKSEERATQAIARIARPAVKDEEIPELVGRVVVEQDLENLLAKPRQMKERLSGKMRVADMDPDTAFDYMSGREDSGLIGELSDDLHLKISSLSRDPRVGKINKENIYKRLVERKYGDVGGLSGGEKSDALRYKRKLKEILDPQKVTEMDLSQAQRFKQNLGRKLNEKTFQATEDKAMATTREVRRDIYRTLKDAIEKAASNVPVEEAPGVVSDAGKFVRAQNQRISNLIKIADALDKSSMDEITKRGLLSKLQSAGIGGAGTAAAGAALGFDPVWSFAVGSGVRGAAEGAGFMGKHITPEAAARGARIFKRGAKTIEPIRKGTAAAAPTQTFLERMAREDEEGREPQSLEPEPESTPVQTGSEINEPGIKRPDSTKNVPEAVIRTKLPRTTEELIENKEMVKAKVAQMAPEFFDGVSEALDNPYELSKVMPLVVQRFPNLFMPDRYNRFDGKVLSDQDKMEASDDILNRDDLSDYQKAEILSHLNKTGRLVGVD